MKKLLEQIIKFGIVGFICFFIDYFVGLMTLKLVEALGLFAPNTFTVGSQIGAATGFIVSVICNYLLSFKFVFERKEDMNRKAEFTIFLVLSVIGLLLNALIIWICTGLIYGGNSWLQEHVSHDLMYTGAKVIATAIVMVYNFITRKVFLSKKD